MYYYLMIESKMQLDEHKPYVFAYLEDVIQIIKYIEDDHRLIIYYQSSLPYPLKDFIFHMISETYQDLRMYQSYTFDALEDVIVHQTYISSLMQYIPFNTATYIDDKILLKYLLEQRHPINKQMVLKKYANNSEMMLTLNTFFEHNQHINQTANELYIHRNTLLQRLDKFHQITGFDVKKFQDAFIIYQLL